MSLAILCRDILVTSSRSWVLARFRLQETLAEVATERGIKIKFNSPVLSIDQDRPAVILKDGVEMEADLIIGADGKLLVDAVSLVLSLDQHIDY